MKLFIPLVMMFVFQNLLICNAENKKIDSLISIAQSNRKDTLKIIALNKLSMYFENNDTSKAWAFNRQAQILGQALQWIPGLAKTYLITGWLYQDISKYDQSLDYMNRSLRLYQKKLLKSPGDLSTLANISGCYNNLGNVYTNKGNYSKALQNYILGLRKIEGFLQNHSENNEYLMKVTACYINLGSVYAYMNDNKNALAYFVKAKAMAVTLNDSNIVARCLINTGIIYKNDSVYDKSIECFQAAQKIFENQNDNDGTSLCLLNLGILMMRINKYDQAFEIEKQAFEINKKLGNKQNECKVLSVMGEIMMNQNKLPEAEKYFKDALKIAESIQSLSDIKSFSLFLAQLYAKKKDYTLAYKYHVIFSDIKDSIFNKDNSKLFADMKEKYESDKKQQQIIVQKTQLEKKDVEVKYQKTMRNVFLIGFAMMLFLALVIFNSFRQKRKANIIIEFKNKNLEQANAEIAAQRDEIESQRNLVIEQKNEIESIHSELKDSIYYAKRIQQAVLPNLEEALSSKYQYPNSKIQGGLEPGTWNLELEAFVLFKPKDIVSGDFYWVTRVNKWFIITVADCTGHGVPGAFMSMLGVSFLNEIVRKKEISKASEVLDQLRESIIEALQQKGTSGEQKDGMDISLCALNTETLECQFAGANNPLWICINCDCDPLSKPRHCKEQSDEAISKETIDDNNFVTSKTEGTPPNESNVITVNRAIPYYELIELKPDKMPVAIYDNMKPFSNHIINLCKGDILYLASDGYEDQFGGPKGKKFMSKNMKELLKLNSHKSMSEQKEILKIKLNDWMGNGEQVDDITVMGIKI